MADFKYSKDHEWVRIEGGIAVIGISAYAQEQLGDIVYVELPEVGRAVAQKDEIAVVESVKAASELYAPVSGEVTESNDGLADDPAKVNADAMGAGWFFKLKFSDPSELENLMDGPAYAALVAGQG